MSLWRVSGWRLGCGDYGTTWHRLTLRERIREWWHRHIVADDETSAYCSRVDEELDRRINQHLGPPRILHGTAEGYQEQLREEDIER